MRFNPLVVAYSPSLAQRKPMKSRPRRWYHRLRIETRR